MIEEIHIRDLGVIAEATLEPSPGFTVITGETGAGKTMLLTALDLLLGGRPDPALVRSGAERAVVEGRFGSIPDAVVDGVADAGGELDEDALIVARTVAAAGRSRAHLGGRSVPQGLLGDLGGALVAVHGQADQLSLRSRSRQRELVDHFGDEDHAAALVAIREVHDGVRQTERALAQVQADARTRTLEIASLQAALTDIAAANPQPGEDLALREEADRLDNIDGLSSAIVSARTTLTGSSSGGQGALVELEQAARSLARAAEHDQALEAFSEQLTSLAHQASSLDGELGSYLTTLEADPDRLDVVHARRAVLGTLGRSYGMPWAERTPEDPPAGSTDAVLHWARQAQARLDDLTGPGHDTSALRQRLEELTAERDALAATITAGRTTAGAELSAAVTAELTVLAMPAATIAVELTPTAPSATGAEDVAIVLTPHPGAPARPLGQGASGGELSRIMLALEVAMAERRPTGAVGTLVFDEVDAGIGGATANHVGERLAALARTTQVIVVTHLAQVAAYADRQLVVQKGAVVDPTGITQTTVRVVDGSERTAELARMLSGETSDTALRHASDLLEKSVVGRLG